MVRKEYLMMYHSKFSCCICWYLLFYCCPTIAVRYPAFFPNVSVVRFTEKELLSKATPGAATEKAAFSWDEAGPGRRLTEKVGGSNGFSASNGASSFDMDNDDFLLAQALSASLNDVNPGGGSVAGTSGTRSSTTARQSSGSDIRPYMDNIQAFDDPDLALALALSKQDSLTLPHQSSTGSQTSSSDSNATLTKEQIRQKRLEAFNKSSNNG